jgi:hypothetical protein
MHKLGPLSFSVLFLQVTVASGQSVSSSDAHDAVELLKKSFSCPLSQDALKWSGIQEYTGDERVFRLTTRVIYIAETGETPSRDHQPIKTDSVNFSDVHSITVIPANGATTVSLSCNGGKWDCVQSRMAGNDHLYDETLAALCDDEAAEDVKVAVETLIRYNQRR